MKENFLPGFVSDRKYQVIYQVSNIVLTLSFIFFKNSSLRVICLLDACGLLGDVVCAGTTPHALLCCRAPGTWEEFLGGAGEARLPGKVCHPPSFLGFVPTRPVGSYL